MGRKSIIKQFASIGIGTVLVVVINAISIPIITRIVDPETYGIQSLFVTYGSVAASFIYLGMDQSFVRYYYVNEDINYRRVLLRRCIGPSLVVWAVVAIVYMLLNLNSTGILPIDSGLLFSVGIVAYVFITIVDRFASLVLRLSYKTGQYSISLVASKLLYVAVVIIFISQKVFDDVSSMIISTLISVSAGIILDIIFGFQHWIPSSQPTECASRKELIKYGMPFIVSVGIGVLFDVIDKFTINAFGTYSDVGVYSSALSLVGVFSVIQTTFCMLWSPMAIERYENDPEDKEFYIKGNNIISVIMLVAGFSLILVKDFFVIILGEKYRIASTLLPFLVLSPVMSTVSETTFSGLLFLKKSSVNIIPSVVSCIVNLIGNTVLIQAIGVKGAAISTGLSYIVFFVLRTYLGRLYYKIDFNLKAFFSCTVILVGYSFYSTFFAFGLYSVLLYAVGIIAVLVLYWNTVVEISRLIIAKTLHRRL